MSAEEFNPDEMAARAVGDLADGTTGAVAEHAAAEGAEDAAESATSVGSSEDKDLVGMALHTEPNIRVDDAKDDLGVDDAGANLYIAGRKGLDYVLDAGDAAAKEGVPMAVNLFKGAWGVLTAEGAEGAEDDDETDEEIDESEDVGSGRPPFGGGPA
ncbi:MULTISPECIES: hypothetical protein [unclassified Haloferax]|uniref:hypothetical protein n=1 Tax=unclassified Haloferax TaxID=2625095 RepID=UPI0028766C91|nr:MULTISPECIES: hypothetical protein [unclassified Haloferax]MDS0243944.1 hypothetical protein [Haloferax sp. S2CR25]MDS0447065.1 hypothetical protein [Haloferax sp. S2CR25-2]